MLSRAGRRGVRRVAAGRCQRTVSPKLIAIVPTSELWSAGAERPASQRTAPSVVVIEPATSLTLEKMPPVDGGDRDPAIAMATGSGRLDRCRCTAGILLLASTAPAAPDLAERLPPPTAATLLIVAFTIVAVRFDGDRIGPERRVGRRGDDLPTLFRRERCRAARRRGEEGAERVLRDGPTDEVDGEHQAEAAGGGVNPIMPVETAVAAISEVASIRPLDAVAMTSTTARDGAAGDGGRDGAAPRWRQQRGDTEVAGEGGGTSASAAAVVIDTTRGAASAVIATVPAVAVMLEPISGRDGAIDQVPRRRTGDDERRERRHHEVSGTSPTARQIVGAAAIAAGDDSAPVIAVMPVTSLRASLPQALQPRR